MCFIETYTCKLVSSEIDNTDQIMQICSLYNGKVGRINYIPSTFITIFWTVHYLTKRRNYSSAWEYIRSWCRKHYMWTYPTSSRIIVNYKYTRMANKHNTGIFYQETCNWIFSKNLWEFCFREMKINFTFIWKNIILIKIYRNYGTNLQCDSHENRRETIFFVKFAVPYYLYSDNIHSCWTVFTSSY